MEQKALAVVYIPADGATQWELCMPGTSDDSEQIEQWYVRALTASREAAEWVETAPGLSDMRLRDAAWLLERYRQELRQQTCGHGLPAKPASP